jgi:DMSO/TMAO reductase YedYZ molybdopterin-dependent catalytic subunit
MTARRKAPGERWSARAVVAGYDDNGARLPDAAPGAARVVVRWRYGGASRKETFTRPGTPGRAEKLASHFGAAFANGWAADDRGRPVPPGRAAPAPQGLERRVRRRCSQAPRRVARPSSRCHRAPGLLAPAHRRPGASLWRCPPPRRRRRSATPPSWRPGIWSTSGPPSRSGADRSGPQAPSTATDPSATSSWRSRRTDPATRASKSSGCQRAPRSGSTIRPPASTPPT